MKKRLVEAREKWIVAREFDRDFYLRANPDVMAAGVDPLDHFLEFGWREMRDPTPDFSTAYYLHRYADVRNAGLNPFYHYLRVGRRLGRICRAPDDSGTKRRAFHLAQDASFPPDAERAKKVMVIVIPEHNEMSGGIYSFFSIAKAAYKIRSRHGYRVLLMTRPNQQDVTYTRQRNFRNAEDVFRFEQIVRCAQASEVYLQIPEYAVPGFVDSLSKQTLEYLSSREKLSINILNQKQDIMPEREQFRSVFSLTFDVSMSVAHHSYFSQEHADRYGIPMMLLPAYTDLSEYEPSEFGQKENLIIYSPDAAPYRKDVLDALSSGLPDYKLQEIRGISFDDYMDLATRCRFSVTFGEGFDGYLAQPIYQGGVGFAVYNSEFFPSSEMLGFKNIFVDGTAMVDEIVPRIKELESSQELYLSTNRHMMQIYDSLYSKQDYMRRIENLIMRQFDLLPSPLADVLKPVRL